MGGGWWFCSKLSVDDTTQINLLKDNIFASINTSDKLLDEKHQGALHEISKMGSVDKTRMIYESDC